MFQRRIVSSILKSTGLFVLLTILGVQLSCDRPAGPGEKLLATHPTVASLSPAGTDLLVGMGCADHLVAVSNYDNRERQETKDLPRVGDYQTTDWERIRALSPDVMILQVAADRVPPGLEQRAKELNIKLVNIKIDTLDDIYIAMNKLGEATQSPHKAVTAIESLKGQIAKVEARTKGQRPVRTLIVLDDNAQFIAGPRNFLNDLLKAAGGVNVAGEMENDYPSIDREKLLAMNPDAVIQILPNATPQVLQQAGQFWMSVEDLSAMQRKRVALITDWYAMLPGYHVGELAEKMADALHPSTRSKGDEP